MSDRTKIFNVIMVYWKIALALIAAILLNVVFISLAGDARTDFLKKSEDLNVLFTKRSNLIQLERQFADIAAAEGKVEQSFINNNESVVDFIILIENTAKNTGNKINIRSVLKEDKKGSKTFQIELEGTYSSFINFIAQVENFEKLAFPSNIDIKEFADFETKKSVLKTILDIEVLAI